MRYIHFYGTVSQHDAVYNGEGYEEPWVALTQETGDVTFNRKPSFDDVVFDVMRYDQRKIVVLDADEDIASRVIFVTESGQSAQDIMTNGFISWDMATAFDLIEDDLTIPSDAGFILVTNRSNDYSFEGGSTSDFDGEFVTGSSVTISGVEESQYGFKTTVYYIYDLANRVKHTVNIVTPKESQNDDEPVEFPTVSNGRTPVVQRAISDSGVDVIDVDTLQHAAQLSDNMFEHFFNFNFQGGCLRKVTPAANLGGGTSATPSETLPDVPAAESNGGSERANLVIASTQITDYVEYTVENDTDNNVQTVSVSTKHLFDKRNVTLLLETPFDVQMGSWTYKVEVDGVEVCSTTFNKQYSSTRIAENVVRYNSGDDEWICSIVALGV